MKRALIGLWLLALAFPAAAQTGSPKTPTQMNTEVNSLWPDNTSGQITPFNARQTLLDIIASYSNNSGPVTGPISSAIHDLAAWGNTAGTNLVDVTGVSALPNGPLSVLGPSSALIGSANPPNELLIQSGSLGTPIVAGNTPTVQISRIENIVNGTSSGDGSLGAALRVDASTTNTQQLNGLKVTVQTDPSIAGTTNDNVAIYGAAIMSGNAAQAHEAYSFFAAGEATTAGNGAILFSGDILNFTGAAVPYNPAAAPNLFVGVDLAYNGGVGNNNGGVGVAIRTGGALWDVGLGFAPGSVATTDIQSDSSATYMWLGLSGTHSYGIEWGSATFTVAAIFTPGFVVSPIGAVLAAAGYSVGASIPGVTCSGSPTSSFASTLGIVTHC